MNDPRLTQLLDRYLADLASAAERATLDVELQSRPDMADALARAARLEMLLDEFFADARQQKRVGQPRHDILTLPTRQASRARSFRWAAAAVLFAAMAIGSYCLAPIAHV